MFSKIDVNGPATHPVYQYLKTNQSQLEGDIHWNFAKFLVDGNGKVVRYFHPKNDSFETIEEAIKTLLDA
jgi:glutathione peroxidase